MLATLYVILHKDTDEFSSCRKGMIPRSFENNYGGTILPSAVFAWAREAINVNHPAVPTCHDGEPRFEIPAQDFVFSCSVWIQVPGSAKRFRHRSLSEVQIQLGS